MTVDLINKQYIFNVNIDSNGNQTVNADIVSKQLIVSVDVFKGGKGDKGDKGDNGDKGEDGDNGLSAYEIALQNGFVGTEIEWLESLHGEDGHDGTNGADGQDGQDLTLEDFNVAPEAATLNDADRFLIEQGGVWKGIQYSKIKTIVSVSQEFNTNTYANLWLTGMRTNGWNGGSAGYTSDINILMNQGYSVGGGIIYVAPYDMKLKGLNLQIALMWHTTTMTNFRLIIYASKFTNGFTFNANNGNGRILFDGYIPAVQLNQQLYYEKLNNFDNITIPAGYFLNFAIYRTEASAMSNGALTLFLQ